MHNPSELWLVCTVWHVHAAYRENITQKPPLQNRPFPLLMMEIYPHPVSSSWKSRQAFEPASLTTAFEGNKIIVSTVKGSAFLDGESLKTE